MESSQLGIGPKTAQYIEDDNRRHTWQYLPRIGEFKLHLPKFTAYGGHQEGAYPGPRPFAVFGLFEFDYEYEYSNEYYP